MSDLCRRSYIGACRGRSYIGVGRGAVCVSDRCPVRVSYKSVLQECQVRSVLQECQVRVSYKSVK